MSESKVVYLDYNATTPYSPSVRNIMALAAESYWGNPSSCYTRGKESKKLIDKARQQVAAMIGASSREIIFLSGGTEANNMAIRSVVEAHSSQSPNSVPHAISTRFEHDATLKLIEHLSENGQIRATFVPTNQDGSVDPQVVVNAIEDSTILVTLMLANNETGAMLALEQLSEAMILVNKKRKDCKLPKVYIHIDAAQAIGKVPVNVGAAYVDYLTIVGHKFYGPRVGALYVNKDIPKDFTSPLVRGGGQECGYRPGTENTMCIAGLGEAAVLVQDHLTEYQKHYGKMKRYLIEALGREFPKGKCKINFPTAEDDQQLPNTLSVSFPGKSGSRILANAPLLEASTGAACHSAENSATASKMMLSLLPEEQAIGTVRLSIGRETTEMDLDLAVSYLRNGYEQS
ncbi:Selenocysteine lyase [Nesidiocoris tenuis]|uniref:Selenocysteine lyase n=1 Tax=Nesidiocoris tenuis TaxID=355587 RepID=A0ABN7ATQ6_9HEMI|nr:Selenocysteine lyase [Nesidiocoris tenuis]